MPLDGTLYEDEILRVLRNAQERIRDPKNWIKGCLARDKCGDPVYPDSRYAVQFCARGALQYENSEADDLLNQAAVKMGYASIYVGGNALVHLNNTSDHSTVMAMFDRAIELRQAEIMETVHA